MVFSRAGACFPALVEKQPVMAFIHGGSFVTGSAAEVDPTLLALENQVVVVTMNYRLGPLGFFAYDLGGSDVTGNQGLRDQLVALQWINLNIAAFGGDPSRVTIGGESAGGMSVSSLMATPQAKGLFTQAIPQSGAGHNGISAKTATVIAGEVLRRLDVKPGDSAALAGVSDEQLFEVQLEVLELVMMYWLVCKLVLRY